MIRSKRGFTLMELLLVVAILAIVAAAAAPSFFGGAQDAIAEARKSAFMSNYNSIISAGNLYLASLQMNGTAPAAGNIYTTLTTKGFVTPSTFSVKDSNGDVGTLTAEIVTVSTGVGANSTFRVAIYQGNAAGTGKSGSELTDPAAAYAAINFP